MHISSEIKLTGNMSGTGQGNVMHDHRASVGMEARATSIVIVNSIFNLATLLVVISRYFSRKLTGAGLWWDDYLVFVATILVNIMLVLAGFLMKFGLGNDTGDIHERLYDILHVMVGFRVSFLLCIFANKLSAILFYQRVFVTRDMQIACKVLCIFVVVWSGANLIQEFTICQPLEAFFNGAPCPARKGMDIAVCFFNAFSDVVVLLLPIRPIWKLQMQKKTKVALTIVFTLGLATTTIAILRFTAIIDTDYQGDMIGTAVSSIMYAILEPNLIILCISLPMLQPLWRKFRGGNKGSQQLCDESQKRGDTLNLTLPTSYADDSLTSQVARSTGSTSPPATSPPIHSHAFSWLAPAISVGGTGRRGPKLPGETKSPDEPLDRHRPKGSRQQHLENAVPGRRGPALRVETDWPFPGKGSHSHPAAGHDATAEKHRYQRGRGPRPVIHPARPAPTAQDAARRAEKGGKLETALGAQALQDNAGKMDSFRRRAESRHIPQRQR
ncbi:hypothetical protein F4775DRAFT_597854 [Biscogniauxia sp. FL1348]|nr:hypothetical protein F4775DRAFT_597854 [Biscogniauxia sp. FL1348]